MTIVIDKEKLNENLKSGLVKVTFTKVDGSTRVMTCTLSESVIPQKVETTTGTSARKKNENICSVWDTEVNGWRSFRYDSIQNIEVING